MAAIRFFLFPFALLYGAIIIARNKCYDWGLLKSNSFNKPIIAVGNIHVGGTGKSPVIEYLVRLLKEEKKVAVLSRGYGRKSKGFLLATAESKSEDIGDEPLQYFTKFKNITVAVCESRVKGINEIVDTNDLVLLDDAYQHRSVYPGINILLIDYQSVYKSDFMLPTGNLREPMWGKERANLVVVTKTPKIFSPMERRRIEAYLQLSEDQQLFCSYIKYEELVPITPNFEVKSLSVITKKTEVVLLTGIANPLPLIDFLEPQSKRVSLIRYSDHYNYTVSDIERVQKIYNSIASENKILITTEKDVMRLRTPKLQEALALLPIYYLPIETVFHEKDKNIFDNIILNYVRTNKTHDTIY